MYNFSHILYTHSDYDNVFEIWKYQTNKHLPNSRTYVFTDKQTSEDSTQYDFITYEDRFQYTDRVISCLNKMPSDEEVVIYQHEDMFLYADPDLSTISKFVDMVKQDEVDVISLVRVVENLAPHHKHLHLYQSPKDSKYSTQPSIIKVKTLKKIFSSLPNKNIWEFEKECSVNCDYLRSYYCYKNESKRGLAHYDSSTYPYVATAVCKGQWNMQEYSKELSDIFYEMGYK